MPLLYNSQLYLDINVALARAKERAAAKTADEPYLLELLEISHGIHNTTGQVVYRPFWTAAKYLEQSRRDQVLKRADDVEFTNVPVPIESLLDLQAALDAELTVPRAFQAKPDEDKPSLKQLEAAYKTALLFLKRYQPRGCYE